MNDPSQPYESGNDVWRDFTLPSSFQEPAAEDAAQPPESEAIPSIECWRCGKFVEAAAGVCEYCFARLRGEAGSPELMAAKINAAANPILVLLWIYFAEMVTVLIYGWVERFGFGAPIRNLADAEKHLNRMLIFDVIFSSLTILAMVWMRRSRPLPKRSLTFRVTVWLLAPFVLAAAFAVNWGYHELLRWYVGHPPMQNQIIHLLGWRNPWIWLCICVQPAIFEELFFRYKALGTLSDFTTLHGAVWISAVMFGVAHIFNPLGMPVLILMGVVLGYVRMYSNSMLLPMLMHFAHNGGVVLLNA